jgi:hypothetical protein
MGKGTRLSAENIEDYARTLARCLGCRKRMMPLGLAAIDVAHGRGCNFDHITEGCERLFGERLNLEKISQMSFTLGMPVSEE